uniref:Putative secreted protein n=1 Tax=Ixodes ricinus TaxID=34613 RepID=A0A6B0UIH6_IXORI
MATVWSVTWSTSILASSVELATTAGWVAPPSSSESLLYGSSLSSVSRLWARVAGDSTTSLSSQMSSSLSASSSVCPFSRQTRSNSAALVMFTSAGSWKLTLPS